MQVCENQRIVKLTLHAPCVDQAAIHQADQGTHSLVYCILGCGCLDQPGVLQHDLHKRHLD